MSIKKFSPALCLFAFSLFVFGPARESFAQKVNLQDVLAAAKTIKCSFPLFAIGNWNAAGEASGEIKTASLTMQFDQINIDEGSARGSGNFGNSEIIVRLAEGTLNFIQSFRTGPLYTTTVFAKESKGGRMKAVHTRHEFTDISIPGYTSRPEQHYGDCEILKE